MSTPTTSVRHGVKCDHSNEDQMRRPDGGATVLRRVRPRTPVRRGGRSMCCLVGHRPDVLRGLRHPSSATKVKWKGKPSWRFPASQRRGRVLVDL